MSDVAHSIVRITEREITRDPEGAVVKAMAARERGDVLEVPWWFYPGLHLNPRFHRGEQHRLPLRSGGASEEEL
jgi:hypothetical protein